jgi:hypothetical protein
MKSPMEKNGTSNEEIREPFNPIAMIAVLVLLLSFLAANVYILVSSYMDLY